MTLCSTLEETTALVEVAQGLRPAEMYLKDGQVVNVYSGEVLPANVAIWGRRIAYVGTSEAMIGPLTQVLDAQDYYLLPGFIDPHGHVDHFYSPLELACQVLPGGTTAVFGDCLPTYSLLEPGDFEAFLREVTGLPLKFFFGARAEPPTFWDPERPELFTEERLNWLLDKEEFFGMAEFTPWYRALKEPDLVHKMLLVRQRGKRVEGHLAGCPYEKLNPVVDAGVTSCHEAITAEQVLARLRLGLWVILRQSPIRQDLKEQLRIITENGVSTNRLMMTPDGPDPITLRREGYMDHLVRLAISHGVDPITAIQMATLNPATYFGLDEHLGGIAPSRLADIVLVRDLREPRADVVIANGQIVARDGQPTVDFSPLVSYRRAPNRYRDLSSPIRDLGPSLFRIPASRAPRPFPVIELTNGIITRRLDVTWREEGGRVALDPALGALHLALVVWQTGKVVNGFLAGFGARVGGLATTMNVARELTVLGYSEEDMALAAQQLVEMGGGMVLAEGGRILHQIVHSVGGQALSQPVSPSDSFLAMDDLLRERGFPHDNLFYTLHFLPSNHLLHVRLTPRGIYDVKKDRVLFPPLDISSA